jgi:hypothetical protein
LGLTACFSPAPANLLDLPFFPVFPKGLTAWKVTFLIAISGSAADEFLGQFKKGLRNQF